MRIADISSKFGSSVYDAYNGCTKKNMFSFAKRVTTVAAPIIAVYALAANIPTAQAGPIAYAVCVLGCEAAAAAATIASGGLLLPAAAAALVACANGCLAAIALPCP